MSAGRLDYVVDGEALIRRNLACAPEPSVRAYLDALESALRDEFAGSQPELVCCVKAGSRESVQLEGGDEETRAALALRARAVADAVKRCVPWPVYE